MSETQMKDHIPANEHMGLSGPDHPLQNYSEYSGTDTPIIIDCGSYQCRAGWGNQSDPTIQFDTIVSKYRERKANEGAQTRVLVGGQINSNINAKANLKCPFEMGILTHPEFMEHIMDYIFLNMGIDSSIEHPIIMTEPVLNPSYSHSVLAELLFEAYSAPAASFGADSLFSYYYNSDNLSNPGLVISASHNNTTVIPIFDMKGQLDYSTRINYGGSSAASFLLKSMQLKYPGFPVKMAYSHSQHLLHSQTFFSNDYIKDLKSLSNVNDVEFFNNLDVTIQFPYVEPPSDVKSQEELELIAQKRKAQTEKLREKAAKTAANWLIAKQRELDEYLDLKRSKKSLGKSAFSQLLQDRDFEDEDDLDLVIRRTEKSIQKARDRQLGIEVEEKEVHSFHLVDVPDDELSEDSKREKRKQKLIKAGQEAREKAKKLREEEELKKQQAAEEDERRRSENFDEWLGDLRQQHKFLFDKLHAKRKLREEMTDRRSGASKSRLKSIAKLARDDEDTTQSGRKKRTKTEKEDTFGADDADWMVYRDIDKEEDSDEEQEAEELAQLELKLIEHDPDFQPMNLDQSPTQYLASFQHRFLYGTQITPNDLDEIHVRHQLHMNVERVRVPEVLFQPSILGLGQTGLTETILNILSRLDPNISSSLIQNIIITGGFSQIPNFDNRLLSELTPYFSTGSKLSVKRASNPVLDSWRGAAKWAQDNPFSSNASFYQTKEQYMEYGSDYTMENGLMNPYVFSNSN